MTARVFLAKLQHLALQVSERMVHGMVRLIGPLHINSTCKPADRIVKCYNNGRVWAALGPIVGESYGTTRHDAASLV